MGVLGHCSGTSAESEGHFRGRDGNNVAKDLVRRVTLESGSYIRVEEKEEGEKERKINEMVLDAWGLNKG